MPFTRNHIRSLRSATRRFSLTVLVTVVIVRRIKFRLTLRKLLFVSLNWCQFKHDQSTRSSSPRRRWSDSERLRS